MAQYISDFYYSIASCLSCQRSPVLRINRGSFKIVKLLGEGGFSYVYMVESQNGQIYALKKIRCSFGQESVRQAMQEIEAYKLFNSPYVIKAIDSAVVQESDGTKTAYIVLPFYEKGNLQDLINANIMNNTYFDEDVILHYFIGICKGLLAMHSYHMPSGANVSSSGAPFSGLPSSAHGESDVLLNDTESMGDPDDFIVNVDSEEGTELGENIPYAHRDVKPANVMISGDDTPVLMDLGSCSRARKTIKTRQQALELQDLAAEHCTLPYRAPELFDVKTGMSVDERVDVWSLGCTLFALMYLSSPFEMMASETGASLSLAIVGGRYKFPTEPAYSEELKDLVKMCLVVDPSARPFVSEVMAKALDLLDRL